MARYLLIISSLLLFTACTTDRNGGGEEPQLPDFDRRAMLTVWADEVIIPALSDLAGSLEDLATAHETFSMEVNDANLAILQQQFLSSYLSWQRASPLIIAKAEEIRLREQLNTYPADIALIGSNIEAAGAVNLELPSQTAAQGFPALEFLIYARSAELSANATYRAYASNLIARMQSLTSTALNDWTNGYREVFIQNDGNNATASIDKTVNDYIFHYEKFLRAGKVGIPAGIFSDDPLADRAEAPYAGQSKVLFQEALESSSSFFADKGLTSYLDALGVVRDGELLSQKIKAQFEVVAAKSNDLEDNFSTQVMQDNNQMLALYDEMQKLVVLLKVDMLQALSINVDYVDADGD